jgi:hypothetical protein
MNMTPRTSPNQTLTFRSTVHFHRADKGAMELRRGEAPEAIATPSGRVPKVARLMALAIRFEGMLKRGEVRDYAELAREGHVSRARVTQVMNLLLLAPPIQEAILFLPLTEAGRDSIKEWQVRVIAAEVRWGMQTEMWKKVMETGSRGRGSHPATETSGSTTWRSSPRLGHTLNLGHVCRHGTPG